MNSQSGWEVCIAAIRSLPLLLTVCMWNQSYFFMLTQSPKQPMAKENHFEKAWHKNRMSQWATDKVSKERKGALAASSVSFLPFKELLPCRPMYIIFKYYYDVLLSSFLMLQLVEAELILTYTVRYTISYFSKLFCL